MCTHETWRMRFFRYSFYARGDCECVDEPLYAHYLITHPHVHREYRDELIASMDGDGTRVVQQLTTAPLPVAKTLR